MSWLNNASSIASLIMAIFGFIGYIYGAMSYLTRKAHSAQQDSGLETASAYIAQKSSIPYRPLSWMEWMEMFGYGLVDTAYFVNGLFPVGHETKYMRDIQKIGYCCMRYAMPSRKLCKEEYLPEERCF